LHSDDAELHFSHPDLNVVQTQLQLDLNAVAQWISSSCLCLNVVKSNAMLIGSQQRLSGKALTVLIGGTVLNQVKSLQYLGVLIDSTLSWSLHITSVASRVRSRISSILRFEHYHLQYYVCYIPHLSCPCSIIVMWFGLLLLLN